MINKDNKEYPLANNKVNNSIKQHSSKTLDRKVDIEY